MLAASLPQIRILSGAFRIARFFQAAMTSP